MVVLLCPDRGDSGGLDFGSVSVCKISCVCVLLVSVGGCGVFASRHHSFVRVGSVVVVVV